MRTLNVTLLDKADASQSHTSAPVYVKRFNRCSFQAAIAGTSGLNAQVYFECSNDEPPADNLAQDFTPTNWSAMPNTTPPPFTDNDTVTGAGVELSYCWARVRWDVSGGTGGTITVKIQAQGWMP